MRSSRLKAPGTPVSRATLAPSRPWPAPVVRQPPLPPSLVVYTEVGEAGAVGGIGVPRHDLDAGVSALLIGSSQLSDRCRTTNRIDAPAITSSITWACSAMSTSRTPCRRSRPCRVGRGQFLGLLLGGLPCRLEHRVMSALGTRRRDGVVCQRRMRCGSRGRARRWLPALRVPLVRDALRVELSLVVLQRGGRDNIHAGGRGRRSRRSYRS